MGRGAAVTMNPPSTSDRAAGGLASQGQHNRNGSMFETFEPKTQSARYERARVWGIDCADVLRWKRWEPGGTYVRSVVLKNTSTKAVKVKYKLPATRYFEMEFPEVIKLSPGMSVSVDVTFRPIKREQYDDFVEFKVAGCGSFRVAVVCPLPVLSLQLPPICDLGYGAVNQVMSKTLSFTNDGDVDLTYEWRLDLPFHFEPKSGALAPGQTATVTCEFTPTDATVSVASAACLVTPAHDFHDGGVTCPFAIDVRAVGKYPFIRLSDKELDFGQVSVGKTVEKTIRVLNQTPVVVNVQCTRDAAEHDNVFKCNAMAWKSDKSIGLQSHEYVRISYTPSAPGTFSNETWSFTTPGGARSAMLRATGTAVGPSASLTVSTLQFGSVVAGTSVKRIFDVRNHGDVSMFWQIDSDKFCTFGLDVDRGTVSPGEAQRVLVTFAPHEAANYHKRLLVLIKDASPLAIDVVGTCYDSQRRPAPMYLSHVETYRSLCASSLLAPGAPPVSSDRPPFEEEIVAARADAELPRNTFASFFRKDPFSAVSVDTTEVDFGSCSRLKLGEAKTVVVTNTSVVKMTVFWGGCFVAKGTGGDESVGTHTQQVTKREEDVPPFAVFPESADIKPGETQPFRVVFRPEKDHKHYHRQIECFAYAKSMRSFRQVQDGNFTPPWCVHVRAMGHTFGQLGGSRIGFVPKVRFSVGNNALLFPPTVKGDVSYQTVALINDGDIDVGFEFPGKRLAPRVGRVSLFGGGGNTADALSLGDGGNDDADEDECSVATDRADRDRRLPQHSPFACYPTKGVVNANSFTLITFRFDANDTSKKREPVVCVLNGDAEHALALDVRAVGFLPKLRIGAYDSFAFKPTCVGAVATREVDITNLSRINVLYEWAIPEKLRDVLCVAPQGGIARGGETVKSVWSFFPKKMKKLNLKIPLTVRVPNSYEKDTKTSAIGRTIDTFAGGSGQQTTPAEELVHVSVAAEGVSGRVAMRPLSLDFGPQIVDQPSVKRIELVNESGGVIRFRLETVFDDECTEFDADVTYSEKTGLVPARAGKFIDVKFTGRHRQHRVSFKINCHTVDAPFSGTMSKFGKQTAPPSHSMLSLVPSQDTNVDPDDLDEPPPCVGVCASASYPALRVRDVACVFVAKPVLWKQLSINDLNKSLALTPTPFEMKQHRLGGLDGSFASTRNISQVQGAVAVGLGVGVRGDATTSMYLEFENHGTLPTTWSILLRNQVEVELENWVEQGAPIDEVDAHQRFVVEEGMIEITPKKGVLLPGQRQPVRITYKHQHAGSHWLTALLRVTEGRSVRFELGGRTLTENHRCLDVGPANPSISVHTFLPVTIGDTGAPAQTIELRNPTNGAVRYSLDLQNVENLNAEAWDFPVLTCVERIGIVPPRGSALVNWVFQPLEQKTYVCDVGVTLTALDDEGDVVGDDDKHVTGEEIPFVEHCVLTLRGAGVLPETFSRGVDAHDAAVTEKNLQGDVSRNHGQWLPYTPWPTLPPTHDFQLSTHVAGFGSVPAASITRRLVILKSHAPDAFNFSWDVGAFGSDAIDGALTIEPSVGTVDAHGVVFVKLTYAAKEKPQVFDGKVTCVLTPVRPTIAELEEERRLTAARRARPETFAQHSDSPQPSMPSDVELGGGTDIYHTIRNGTKNTNRMSVVHAHTVSSSRVFPDLALAGAVAHSKTIPPPILNDGIPPDAFLTLGVEGRVVSQVTHREDVGSTEYSKHFVPSFAPDAFFETSRTRKATRLANEDPDHAHARLGTPEKKHVLAGLLHDVLQDPAVRREFETLKREPPGYFAPDKAGEVVVGEANANANDNDAADANRSVLPDELDVTNEVDDYAKSTDCGVSTRPGTSIFGSAAGWVGGDETGFPTDVDPAETRKASVNPEFRTLAEWTMEQTLWNLVKELHAAKSEEAGFETENGEYVQQGNPQWDSAGEESFDYEDRSD